MSDNPQRVRYPLKRERPSFEQDGLEILEVCPTAPKIPVFRIKSPEVSCQRTNPIAFPQKGWNQAQNPVVQEAVVPYIVPDLQLPPQNPQNLHPIGTACSFLGCTSCIPLQPIVNILPMVLIPVVQRPSQFLGKGQVGPSEQVSATVWQTIIDHCRQNPVYNSPLGNVGLSALLDPKGVMKFPQLVRKMPRDKIVFWQEVQRQKTGIRGSKLQWQRLPNEEKAKYYMRWRELKDEAKWQKEQGLIVTGAFF